MLTDKTLKDLLSSSLLRYLIIGGSTVLIDLGLLALLKQSFGVNVYLAATISFWTSLVFNFGLNKFWTFGVKSNTVHHLFLYGVLILINYLTGLAFIGTLAHIHVNYLVAKTLSLGLTTIWNYFLYKYVIFVTVERRQSLFAKLRLARVSRT